MGWNDNERLVLMGWDGTCGWYMMGWVAFYHHDDGMVSLFHHDDGGIYGFGSMPCNICLDQTAYLSLTHTSKVSRRASHSSRDSNLSQVSDLFFLSCDNLSLSLQPWNMMFFLSTSSQNFVCDVADVRRTLFNIRPSGQHQQRPSGFNNTETIYVNCYSPAFVVNPSSYFVTNQPRLARTTCTGMSRLACVRNSRDDNKHKHAHTHNAVPGSWAKAYR